MVRHGAAMARHGRPSSPARATRPVGFSPATNHETWFPLSLRRLQGEQPQARPTGFHESRDTRHETRLFRPFPAKPQTQAAVEQRPYHPRGFWVTRHETRITRHGFYGFHETRDTKHESRLFFAVGAQGTHNQKPPPGPPRTPPGRCFPARYGAAWRGNGAAWAAVVPRSGWASRRAPFVGNPTKMHKIPDPTGKCAKHSVSRNSRRPARAATAAANAE